MRTLGWSAATALTVAFGLAVGWLVTVGHEPVALLLGSAPILLWVLARDGMSSLKVLPFLVFAPSFLPGVPFSLVAWLLLFLGVRRGVLTIWRAVPAWLGLGCFLFLSYAVLTMMFGNSQPAMTLMVVVTFTLPVLMMLRGLTSEVEVLRFTRWVARAGLAAGVLALAEKFAGRLLVSEAIRGPAARLRFGEIRAQLASPHPIALGIILALFFLVTLGRILAGDRRLLPHAVVMLCAVFVTYSRGPLVLLAVATVIFMLLSSRTVVVRRGIAIAALCITVALLSPWRGNFTEIALSMVSSDVTTEQGQAIQSRLVTNRAVWEFVGDNPGGVGFYGLSDTEILTIYDGRTFNAGRSVDNSYLLAFAELGWAGGGLFVFLLLSVFLRACLVARKARSGNGGDPTLAVVASALGGFAVAAFTVATLTTWAQVALCYWTVVGIGLALERIPRNSGPVFPEPIRETVTGFR